AAHRQRGRARRDLRVGHTRVPRSAACIRRGRPGLNQRRRAHRLIGWIEKRPRVRPARDHLDRSMDQPRIGITCSPLRGPAYYAAYLRAIEAAGGRPVELEPSEAALEAGAVTALLQRIDGLLLPGGRDVGPPAHGEARQDGP